MNAAAISGAVTLVTACLFAGPAAAQSPPDWAYPVNPPGFQAKPAGDHVLHVQGSRRSYLPAQVRDLFNAPDWHPREHPLMPDVVAHGRKPDVYACGVCHRADGPGGPENSSLAGLPAAYIVQQMADFKSGARKTSVPERLPPTFMIALSRAVSVAEVEAAAQYFSSVPAKSRIKVIETDTVPSTYVAGWFLAANPAAAREPIGRRIIEVPEDLERFESRDTHSRFLAYVPHGSVKAGRALVRSGSASGGVACASCHGADLKGMGLVPGIAGRSPSYVVRQLFDIQSGARAGAAVAPMQEAVGRLTVDDMLAIAAYLSTLH